MRFLLTTLAAALAIGLALPSTSAAQGGGASSTGTIQGRVADASGAVLPGVTVTATSPSVIGAQTQVTDENGTYRFPAVPPGIYELTFELAGFNTVKRGGIQISLGFTANVNVELALATLQETVTVAAPRRSSTRPRTRVQQNFKLEQLQSIPNGRDMWALLAVTPGVAMSRIDVGGNRAGTQTGYTAYGLSGQVRVLDRRHQHDRRHRRRRLLLRLRVARRSVPRHVGPVGAEMPNPGVQSQFIAQVGRQQVPAASIYLDWYNNSLQGSNLPDEYIVPTAFNNGRSASTATRCRSYYDIDINVGGPIKKDKVWWFGTYRNAVQRRRAAELHVRQDLRHRSCGTPSARSRYQMNQKNKLIGYYQWGQKTQPNRLPFGDLHLRQSPEPTDAQKSRQLGLQGRMERHAQRQAVSSKRATATSATTSR